MRLQPYISFFHNYCEHSCRNSLLVYRLLQLGYTVLRGELLPVLTSIVASFLTLELNTVQSLHKLPAEWMVYSDEYSLSSFKIRRYSFILVSFCCNDFFLLPQHERAKMALAMTRKKKKKWPKRSSYLCVSPKQFVTVSCSDQYLFKVLSTHLRPFHSWSPSQFTACHWAFVSFTNTYSSSGLLTRQNHLFIFPLQFIVS